MTGQVGFRARRYSAHHILCGICSRWTSWQMGHGWYILLYRSHRGAGLTACHSHDTVPRWFMAQGRAVVAVDRLSLEAEHSDCLGPNGSPKDHHQDGMPATIPDSGDILDSRQAAYEDS